MQAIQTGVVQPDFIAYDERLRGDQQKTGIETAGWTAHNHGLAVGAAPGLEIAAEGRFNVKWSIVAVRLVWLAQVLEDFGEAHILAGIRQDAQVINVGIRIALSLAD